MKNKDKFSMEPKVIRLTESDLEKIVERVLNEQKTQSSKVPMHPNTNMPAFIKVEKGKKYVHLEWESEPGRTSKWGPVVAPHLKDGDRFLALEKNGKLIDETNKKVIELEK
jgi:hypothetical protein